VRVETGEAGIEYDVTGQGRPVILLHGFPDSGTRCTGCWPGNTRRSSTCSRPGARSTAPTASWPTAARGRGWCTSTVRRVLAAEGLVVEGPPPREPAPRAPWPDWLEWKPNRIWACDFTHGSRAQRASIAILDVVSRKWLATLTSAEETSTQAEACFLAALDAENLLEDADQRATEALREAIASGEKDKVHGLAADGQIPLLPAISDNGPQMRSVTTREFLAGVAIAQQFGRPHTPQDQAWIETLSGHVKGEWPHLEKIRDPGEPVAELDRVRSEYNTVRLHAAIGYVTPDDEHEGRGDAIRQQRRDGLAQARENRIA
jgi:putative transposase